MPGLRLIMLLAAVGLAGGCETTVQLEAPDQPIEMALDVEVTYDVVVRPPTPTGALGMDRVPTDPTARERLINRSLDHALVEAAGDRALLFRARQNGAGIRLDASHEITAPSTRPVLTQLRNLPLDPASPEGAATADGKCYFRYVEDLEDLARIHQLEGQSVTALAACPVIAANGRLVGVVSVNWDRGQTVNQDRAHSALSEAASALVPLIGDN